MPEIFSLIFNFVDVFEKNFDLAGKFSSGTQEYIQVSNVQEEKNNDTINVKIEAPVLIVTEKNNTWAADLGTFEVRKDPSQSDARAKALTFLEVKQTTVYFTEKATDLANLNSLEERPDCVREMLNHMKLIVSDLGFLVELGKSKISVKDGSNQADRRVATVNLNCKPFKVNLIEHSMQSLFHLITAFASVGSRTDEKIKQMKEKAQCFKEGTEYHQGYNIWEKCEVYIDNFMMHLLNAKGKLIASYPLTQLTDITKKEKDGERRLVMNFKHKKVEVRSKDARCVTELQFKISSVESFLKSQDTNSADAATKTAYSNDLVISLSLKAIDLHVSGYHKDGVDFFIKLSQARYSNKSIDGIEEGVFTLQNLSILDNSDGSNIISLRQDQQSLSYSYLYQEGSLDSTVSLKYIEASYKEDYIRSLLKLVEFVIENLMNSEDTETGQNSQEKAKVEEEVSLLPVATTTYSARSDLKVKIDHWKAAVFYKKNLKCLEFVSKNIGFQLIMEGSVMNILGDIGELGAYDLHRYPFKQQTFKDSLAVRVPIVQMKKGGFVHFNVTIDEKESKANVSVKNIVVEWVQQRAMRLIDFIMFQVLEVFYPSLYSFSKYYSRENVIRFALALLNDPAFVKQHIELEDVEFNLCSTTNMDHKISLVIENILIDNDRRVLDKVINKADLAYFPFGGLESDIWTIELRNAKADIVDESLLDEMATEGIHQARERHTEYFSLFIEVDFLTKLFELSFLYHIVDDFEMFDEKTVDQFKKHLLNRAESYPKTKPAEEELKLQAHHFIQQKSKERIYLNGRYNIKIAGSILDIDFTNRFLNKVYAISSNNISFDDGQDDLFRNTYLQSTAGLQVFVTMRLKEVVIRAKDFKQRDFELFRIEIGNIEMVFNKRSNFVNEITVDAATIKSIFNSELGIPKQYLEFLGPYSLFSLVDFMDRGKQGILQLKEADIEEEKNDEGVLLENNIHATILMTPDYKKDIQMTISNTRLIVFTFITRLFPELLTLEPLVEHKGYEDPNFSLINILVRLDDAEICLASNREGCIVVCGKFLIMKATSATT